jgi:predicted MFS family arabinose efflux permease
LFTPPFFATALRGVGPQETGSAAGLLNAVQQLGGTLGVAVVGGVYLAGADAPRAAAQAALATAGAILAATAIATAVMTSRRATTPLTPPPHS